MKSQKFSYFLAFIAFAIGQIGIGPAQAAESPAKVFPLVAAQSQTNLTVIADGNDALASLAGLSNRLANTNLFTASERAQIELLQKKYQNVSTNSGPPGAVFKKTAPRLQHWRQFTNTFTVSCFAFTNSTALEEVASPYGINTYILAKYREAQDVGYNVVVNNGKLLALQEFKAGKPDGLWVQFFEDGSISRWLRFSAGKAIGQYLSWDTSGTITCHVLFKSPYDLLNNAVAMVSMDWEDAPPGGLTPK